MEEIFAWYWRSVITLTRRGHMVINGYQVKLDSATKFFNSFYIHGWFYHSKDGLKEARIVLSNDSCTFKFNLNIFSRSKDQCGAKLLSQFVKVQQDHKGVEKDLGPNRGFILQALFDGPVPWQDLDLIFVTNNGSQLRVSVKDLCAERVSDFSTKFLYDQFREFIYSKNHPSILDIGGRARSRVDRSQQFPDVRYDVLDIVPGENVDIVGDAHELTRYTNESFYDGIICVSVFEHLLMPWKVALEMNKVLKMGGLALIHTHQSIGMHDLPWDFFRFSSDCWPAIFNKKTGFEIVSSAMDSEHYLLPFIIRLGKEDAEKSAGFEGSSVLVKKIGVASLEWPVTTDELINTSYPTHEDGNLLDYPIFD